MDKLIQLENKYKELYGSNSNSSLYFEELKKIINEQSSKRSKDLKKLDQREENWFMKEDKIGMMLYVDLFSKTILGLLDKLPYLKELGVTIVHLMPLLKSRAGENDGGYAVEDYLAIDSKLGTLDDFIKVLDVFHSEGIDVCIDFVLNHTSDTHEWAQKAVEGDTFYQDMYLLFDDRTIPDQYDQTVPFVLPIKAPGNFTYNDRLGKWVFTSFSEFQWDLNFNNPHVFNAIVEILLQLANLGVSIIRLDAIAFMWKKLGTNCRNLREVHQLIEMMHIIKEIVCPSLVLLGEAIVEPDEIIKYFGKESPECNLLYNANLMVNIFNAFATRDVKLLEQDQMRFRAPESSCFINYVRCHDDIGWGLNERIMYSLGMNPLDHRSFLNDFYSGKFKGSFSTGEIYQYNEITKDARINGTLASLLGLEKSRENFDGPGQREAIQRILLAHALILFEQGLPLIYSGDELGLLNNYDYLNDPSKKDEDRWMHRNSIKTEDLEKRLVVGNFQHALFNNLKKLIEIRSQNKLFHGRIRNRIILTDNKQVYVSLKEEETKILGLFNFSENNQYIDIVYLKNNGLGGHMKDLISGKLMEFEEDEIRLHPYEFLWLSPYKK